MKSRTAQTSNKTQGAFSPYLSLLLFLAIFGYIGFKLVGGWHKSNALEGRTVKTKALVIDKRNYFGNSPVSQQFAYSYSFNVAGKEYVNNSRDPALKIGDSVIVEYAPNDPSINQPVHK